MEGQWNDKFSNNNSPTSDNTSEGPIIWSANRKNENYQKEVGQKVTNESRVDSNHQENKHIVWTANQIQKQSAEQMVGSYDEDKLKTGNSILGKNNKVTFGTVFVAIVSLAFCGLFVFNVYFLVCNLLGVEVPFINKGVVYVVTGAYSPDIEKESYCIYVKDSTNVGIGDYIFFNDEADNMYIEKVGAISEKNGQMVYAVGTEKNIFVEQNQYIGVYEKSSLLIAKFISFCNSLLGYLIMIVLPVGICLAYELICGAKERKLAFNSADNNYVTEDGKVVNSKTLSSTQKELKELKQWAKENAKQREDIYKKQE